VKYFLPDSQDLVDPSFDFVRERRSPDRIRQRDDQYAHEVFADPVFDGILVSKGIVDGYGNTAGKYTLAQKHRFYRSGVRDFFRLTSDKSHIQVMGDCGAFTYLAETVPPYTVDDVLRFYVEADFDYGISVDHVILAYEAKWDAAPAEVPADIRDRQAITFEYARDFIHRVKTDRLRLQPMGVAQGWSPQSYTHAVEQLQKMGYDYIALGGMVPLRTKDILESLEAISNVRQAKTRLHLLGVTRTEHVQTFAKLGVTSFDSTSPLRQAFKDDRDNFYTPTRTYTAVRIPQVEGNARLQKQISSGRLSQDVARKLEKAALDAVARVAAGDGSVDDALDALRRYDEFSGARWNNEAAYRESLTDQPWKACGCEVCRALGHHVILFRGAERNRRRGLHNTWVFYRSLQSHLETDTTTPRAKGKPPKRSLETRS
jgi:hypothetical protein